MILILQTLQMIIRHIFFAKNDIIESLERGSVSLFRWFEKYLLKRNADKCHFLVSASQEISLNVTTLK